jgi:UDP-glucose:(heptosyl)LPS alpha-1,3-glucosyltransferase
MRFLDWNSIENSKNGASEILDKDFVMDNPYDTEVISSIDYLLSNKTALDKEKIKNIKLSKLFSIEKNLNITLEVISQIE